LRFLKERNYKLWDLGDTTMVVIMVTTVITAVMVRVGMGIGTQAGPTLSGIATKYGK